jgi:hypothetical protein
MVYHLTGSSLRKASDDGAILTFAPISWMAQTLLFRSARQRRRH